MKAAKIPLLAVILEAFTSLDLAFADFLQSQMPSSDPRHYVLAALTSHQMGRGHACLDLLALQTHPEALLGWSAEQVQALPAELTAGANTLPWSQGEAAPLVLRGLTQRPLLYLRRAYEAEQSVMHSIRNRLAQPLWDMSNVQEHLNALFPSKLAIPGLIDWQKVACAMAARSALTLITGGPGTGKTTTVVRLLALLTAQARSINKPLRIRLAAPTGKAASRLAESIQSAIAYLPHQLRIEIPSAPETLHRLLQFTPDTPLREVPQLSCDVVVVDEASMIDLEMMARLLAAVPLSSRLIMLGDKDQLASVEAGSVLAQLCDGAAKGGYSLQMRDWVYEQTAQDISAFTDPTQPVGALAQHTVMLRHSRRFSDESGIGQWAFAVNSGDIKAVKKLLNECPSVVEPQSTLFSADVQRLNVARLPGDEVAQVVRQGWLNWRAILAPLLKPNADCSDEMALTLLERFTEFQVLCALRSGPWGVQHLNQCITHWMGYGGEDWYCGRPVMITRNDPNLKLMNGEVGLCLPTAVGLRVAFTQAGKIRWVLPTRLESVETVWATTVHKSQGSEFDHVLFVLPASLSAVMTRELIYTGITRAKKRLTFALASQSVLLQATATRLLRSGGLSELNQEN